MVIFVDIDGTICTYLNDVEMHLDYSQALPIHERIKRINELYEEGNRIIYWTARGSSTNIDWFDITKNQLDDWKCKYHELRMGKPSYDLFIDDKNMNSEQFFKNFR